MTNHPPNTNLFSQNYGCESTVHAFQSERDVHNNFVIVKIMEEDKLKCTFCKQSHDKLILFSEETLKKCKNVLKQRIIHTLKFKDVVLLDDLYDNGYHRECYKNFTALPNKYFSAIPEKPKNAKKKNRVLLKIHQVHRHQANVVILVITMIYVQRLP